MTTPIDICNSALRRIGISQPIASFDEHSKAARMCRPIYDQRLDMILREMPWNFALKFVGLAEVPGTKPPGWGYQYRMPSDCAMVHRLTFKAGDRWRGEYRAYRQLPINEWLGYGVPEDWNAPWRIRKPFRLAYDKEGTLILANFPDAYLIYNARVTDPSLFDALFTDALTWGIAAELAMPMMVETSVLKMAQEEYDAALDKAGAATQNEAVDFADPESPSISVRY